jgi:uncharacterized protein with GYD domain
MAKYLFTTTYTTEGLRGLLKDGGSGRVDAARKATESVGGHLDAMYFGFGDQDVYLICDLPDNKAAAALSLVVGASGGANSKTVVLLTPEEVDRATREAVDFRPPGA